VLVEEALGLAVDYGVTSRDATYTALARRLELGLVTADERLVDCLAEADVDVWHLSGL
jgi:predicted nucleic acid-binding protein